jgi:uncharacterized protein (TIGR02271 family)
MTNQDSVPFNTVSVVGNLDLNALDTELHFADGRIVRVPTSLLQQDHAFAGPQATGVATDATILIPLVQEQLQVGKRTVETGKVQLQKSSEAYDVTLDESLAVSIWKVERVPMNEVVERAPASRQEGSTTIYPLVEERLVLTKQLVLVEEIRVTQEFSERRDTQTVTLRRETLSVDREPAQQA